MFNDVIRQLLQKVEVLPKKFIISYLMQLYKISERQAQQAVHSACRARVAYDKDEYIARSPYAEIDSSLIKKAKALAVMLEVTHEKTDFSISSYPWLISFLHKNKYVQVCHISKNTELVESMVFANKPVSLEERAATVRIAIVEEGCDLKKIKAAGFIFFCTVNDNFKVKIIAKIPAKDAWKDVDEK